MPGVGLRLHAGEHRLDLGQVVDQVVGDPAHGLGRCVDAVAVLADARPAVPVDPGVHQREGAPYRLLDGVAGVLELSVLLVLVLRVVSVMVGR